jgi:hypothetical protein
MSSDAVCRATTMPGEMVLSTGVATARSRACPGSCITPGLVSVLSSKRVQVKMALMLGACAVVSFPSNVTVGDLLLGTTHFSQMARTKVSVRPSIGYSSV